VLLEGLSKLKNPLVSSGIKLATVRLVALVKNEICKDLEGSGHVLIELQSQHLPRGTGKTTKNLIEDRKCRGRDSNPVHS
jgi:hypothetical protein